MVKIAILGFGVVGSGVQEVITMNENIITKKCGDGVSVAYILDTRELKDSPYYAKVIHDFSIIENDPEVRVVCETIGGITPAFEFTRRALCAGKHVVTSNKELVATHGTELLALAKKHNVNYMFEASVGGGIPIIRPMVQCLTANELVEICGILNGTTNYILTRMIRAGLSFDVALKEAQEKGYAEANPAADIEGHDACRKTAILASLALGKHVAPEYIETEGITNITLEDVANGAMMGKVIKLLGRISRAEDGKIFAFVAPHMIDFESPLSSVEGVNNAILIKGNAVGEVMFYGPGAGKLPTASAVVADVIDCIKHIDINRLAGWDACTENLTNPLETLKSSFYVRLSAKNNTAFEDACNLLGAREKFTHQDAPAGEFSVMTDVMTSSALSEKLSAVDAQVLSTIRIL